MAGKILRKVQSSITTKIFLAAVLLLIVPVCAVSGFAWRLLYSEMYENEMSAYDTAVRQTANSIDRIFDDVLSASNMMITDDIIRAKMIDVTSTATFSDHTDVEHQFFTIQTSTLDHYANCILIVMDRHRNCYSNESDEAVNAAVAEKLLAQQSSPATASGIRWHDGESTFPALTSTPYLVFSRNYRDYLNANPLGNIIICVSEDEFREIMGADRQSGDGSCSIVSASGRVLVSTSPSLQGKPFALSGDTGHIVSRCQLSNGWYLVNRTDKASLNKLLRGRMTLLLLGLLLIAVLFSLFIAYFTRTILSPIVRLSSAAKAVSAGDLSVRTEVRGHDELHRLATTFNTMVVSLNRLVQNTADTIKREKSLEIQMLYAQINPHFLFNTLNSIRWSADASGAPNVSRLIVALATILHGTILNKKECISIREEIENIKSYIYIQQFRYPGRFQVEYDIDERLEDCLMPKFIIQPLVENSILHGFDGMAQAGKITLRIFRREEGIAFEVEDNGRGIPGALREGLLRSEKGGSLNHIGLSNVNQRLVLKYGPASAIFIENPPGGGGTRITFWIPEEKGESDDV